MSGTVSSSIEKERPRLVFHGNPMVLYVALAVILGWLGVNALVDAIRESRERDAATMQGFFDSRPAEEGHGHAAVVAPKAEENSKDQTSNVREAPRSKRQAPKKLQDSTSKHPR